MSSRFSKPLRYILSLGVAVVLLWFSFREVEWGDFIEGLRSCRWKYILLSMLAGIAAFYIRGLRWRELLLPIDRNVSRRTTFNGVNIGYIANFVFPRIGEFVRCGVVSGRSTATYDKVLGTVVLERSWDMVVMLLFLIALLVFRWDQFGTFFMERMWAPLEDKVSFSLWWMTFAFAAVAVLSVWIVVRFRKRNRFCGKLYGIFKGLLQGILSCMKMPHKWLFLVYTAIIWSIYWLMSASTMWALPELDSLNVVDALFLMIAGSLGWLVPVPGGFGAFHFIVSLALSSIYGIPFELGIVFATLSHESQAITMALCGGVSYLDETLTTSRKTIRKPEH